MTSIGYRIARGAGWTVSMRLLERFLGLLSTLVLARLLVPEDFGVIAMATSVAAILEAITAFGFEWAIIQKRTEDPRHLNTAWSLNVLVGFANALAIVSLTTPAALFYSEPRVSPVMFALAFTAAVTGFRNIGMVRFEQELDFRYIVAMTLGRKAASVIVTVSAALYFRSYWALVAGLVAGAVIEVLLSYALHPFRPRFTLSNWRELFGFSKWLLLSNLLGFLAHRGFDLIIGSRAGAPALGTYSLAYELSNLPTTELVTPVMRAVYPGYAKLASQRSELAGGFRSVLSVLAVFAVPAGAGIACLAEPIVYVLLGEKWAAVAPLMVALAFFGMLRAIQANTGSVYLAIGEPRIVAALTGTYVLMSLPLFAVVLSTTGLVTASWVLVACSSFVGFVNFFLLTRRAIVTVSDLLSTLTRPVVAAGVMAVVLLASKEAFWSPGSWTISAVGLLGLVLLGAMTYFAALIALWTIASKPAGPETVVLRALRSVSRRRLEPEPNRRVIED